MPDREQSSRGDLSYSRDYVRALAAERDRFKEALELIAGDESEPLAHIIAACALIGDGEGGYA